MEQRAEVDGSGNVVVQIEGDRNTVNLKGLAHLTLTRFLQLRAPRSDADRLSPYALWIPLVGRERELADLRSWLDSEQAISVRVLTGRAGSGKTRLALELCEDIRKAWDAGFVRYLELRRFMEKQNLSTWGWQRPTLVVIDYAASHADVLYGWLSELADYSERARERLRLLLLERHADAGSGWWQTVFDPGGFSERGIERLLDPKGPIAVEPIAGAGDRRKIVETVLAQKAAPSGVDGLAVSEQQLAELTRDGEPLFLMMNGHDRCRGRDSEHPSTERAGLASALAKRELKRITDIGQEKGVKPEFLQVMAAYVTLCRGLAVSPLCEAIKVERAALDLEIGADPHTVAELLCEALPGPKDSAGPILPDMVGEAVILHAFTTYGDHVTEAIQRACNRAGQQAAATIIRTAQDFAPAGYEAPLTWLDSLINRVPADRHELMMIADALPEASVALAPLAVKLQTIITKFSAERRQEEPHDHASSLLRLAARLSQVGRFEEALAAAKEAADLYRALGAQAPDAYTPALAGALISLANRLSEVGQPEAALGAAQEAAGLYRGLVKQAPGTYRPTLAAALVTLANSLSAVGQREAALAPAQEAADLYRELGQAGPGHLPARSRLRARQPRRFPKRGRPKPGGAGTRQGRCGSVPRARHTGPGPLPARSRRRPRSLFESSWGNGEI